MVDNTRSVVLVAFESAQLLDLAGPADVFDAATRALARQDTALLAGEFAEPGAVEDAVGYRLAVAAPGGRPFRTTAGMLVVPDVALEAVNPASIDTMVVAGSPFIDIPLADAGLIHQISRIADGARRAASVCSGAFLLAAAGTLDGHRATTHWAGSHELARRHPKVTVEPDRIYIRDGAVTTSAGVTAGIDMALALVEDDHGSEVALSVARWLVMFLRRSGGQSQYSERLALPPGLAPAIRMVVEDIVKVPSGDHRVPVLARRLGLSERHVSRVFRYQTGVTPGRFVERVRVEAARGLLERTVAPLDDVAREVGFGSAETLRRAFSRVIGTSPSDYRNRFPVGLTASLTDGA